jgi:hypothetical protein
MKKLLIFLVMFPFMALCQEINTDSLLLDITGDLSLNQEPQSLLPERMMFTQRMLWGENGLYRKVGIAPRVLTPETREHELKIRRTMFRIHQAVGLTTAAAMVAQGFLGSRLYDDNREYNPQVKKWHEGVATGINIGYATTALMSFTSPPPFINRKKFDNIKLHKILSYVHLTGMITTNVLAGQLSNNYNLKKFHRAAAYTTFGAYALAIASIKFEL